MSAENSRQSDAPSVNDGAHVKKKTPQGRPWPKGVSGNPGGAPKGKRVSTWLAHLGEMTEYQLKKLGPLPMNGRIALAILRDAAKNGGRNANGARDIHLDRTEGKVEQPLTGKGGEPLVVQVVKYGQLPEKKAAERGKEG
jgi:hypothetical protein